MSIRLTLLELVQDMLSAVDSESVTDVGETEEAGMAVSIANRSYEKIIEGRRWCHLRGYHQLSTSANLNEMTLPSGTIAMNPHSLYYETVLVWWMEPEEFLDMTIARDTSEANIQAINNIKVFNDRNPQFFTSDDDETLRFDAIPDSGGLQGSDTNCIAYVAPTSRKTANGDIFDLPGQAFPALNELCIATAIAELKGDTQTAAARLREYKALMARLTRTSRLIDLNDDLRKWIVPRRSLRMVDTQLRRVLPRN